VSQLHRECIDGRFLEWAGPHDDLFDEQRRPLIWWNVSCRFRRLRKSNVKTRRHAILAQVSMNAVQLHVLESDDHPPFAFLAKISRETLRHWRREFAHQLRARGVEANATERRVRGQSRVPKLDSIFRAARRGESSHMTTRVYDVVRELEAGSLDQSGAARPANPNGDRAGGGTRCGTFWRPREGIS
jgi:hypothetical protein